MSHRKPDHALTLHDRLSQLTFTEACKLLGPRGAVLIRKGGQLELEPLDPVAPTAEQSAMAW